MLIFLFCHRNRASIPTFFIFYMFRFIIIVFTILDYFTKSLNIWAISAATEKKYSLPTKINSTFLDEDLASYHHCLNGFRPETKYRRCRLFNICAFNMSMTYFVHSPNERANRLGTASNNNDGKKNPMSSGAPPLFCADNDCSNLFTPLVTSLSIKDFARERNIEEVVWHQRPAFLLNKRGCTNPGHCFNENLLPIVVNMLIWQMSSWTEHSVLDNDILMMEGPAASCGCDTNFKACWMEGIHAHKLCNLFTERFVGAASENPLLYFDALQANNEMHCWSTAYGGTGGATPYTYDATAQMESMGFYFSQMRELILYRNNVTAESMGERAARLLCHESGPVRSIDLKVLVGAKSGKRMIVNIAEVAEWVHNHTFESRGLRVRSCPSWECAAGVPSPPSPCIRTSPSQSSMMVNFQMELVEWEKTHSLKDQLHLLSTTDIFVTNPGSGAMNSVFLPDWSSVITAPFCDLMDCEAMDGFSVHEHLVDLVHPLYLSLLL